MALKRLVVAIGVLFVVGALWQALRPGSAAPARQRPAPDRDLQPRGRSDYRSEARTLPRARPRRTVPWDKQRLWSGHIDWEPVVAADPGGDRIYQLATRYYTTDCVGCPDPVMVFRRSDDGGDTWGADRYPFRGGRAQNDAQLAVDATGVVHAAWLEDFEPGVSYARSIDGGDSWSVPIAFTTSTSGPSWSDHPFLLVSRDGRDIYLAFNAGDSWVAASHDGGATFAPPVRTNDDARSWFHTGGAIGPDGAVLIAATDYRANYIGAVNVSLLRSDDGGVRWETTRVDTTAETPGCPRVPGCYLGFLGPRASVAVDSAGSYLLVYNGARRDRAPQRLWSRRSGDGRAWTPRKGLKRPDARVDQTFPIVAAVGPAGEFLVAWVDDRRAARERWNIYVRRTTDGGRRWDRATRISAGGPATGYRDGRGFAFPYGDYFGLSIDGAGVPHLAWGAGESYSGNGGVWYTRGRRSTGDSRPP